MIPDFNHTCIKRLPVFIVSICVCLLFALNGYGQSSPEELPKGSNGPLSLKEILEKVKQGKAIDGYKIKGDDFISVIKQTDAQIFITNAIITGGLKFSQLPEMSISEIVLPSNWSEKQKQQFIEAKTKIFNTYYCVKNFIKMINCDIEIDPSDYRSVSAERTFFFNTVCFQKTTFKGDSYWTDAILGHDFLFNGTQFQAKASFVDAFFYGTVDCQDAFFGSHGAVFMKTHFFSKHVRFSNARFRFASFRGAEFWGETDFTKTSYEKEAYFTDVNFFESVNFSESSFSGAVFIRSIFHDNVFFQNAQMHIASFQNVIFKKDVQLNQTIFTGTAFFNNAEFKQVADFSESEFKCTGIQFKQVQFNGNAIFLKVRFHGPVLFSKSIFTGNQVIFQEANFLEDLYFVKADIKSHEIDFHNMVVHGVSNFQSSIFTGDTNFSECQFFQKTDFSNASFHAEADFFHVTCRSPAVFSGVTFMGDAEFSKNQFYDHSNFSEVSFQQLTDFSGSSFKGNVDFSKTSFQSSALFRNVVFSKEGSFYEAIFHDTVDFFESIFYQLAYFRYSQFYHIFRVKNAAFYGYVDFRNCLIKKLDLYSQKSPTIIKNRVDFRNAWIGAAHLQDVVFEDDVDFSGVIFGGDDDHSNTDDHEKNAVVFRFVSF
ncbi:MAG: pentapeptide repeat-containing protein, partial [Candidatus Magnetomorum sp.]|nr:pentapeptide repeat-containing protein [Candidatus Magnetomorum sp.]